MTENDLSYFSQLQSDTQLMQFIGPVLSPEQLQAKFAQRICCFEDHCQWFTLLIFDRDSAAFYGSVGFRLQDVDSKRVEIGYVALAPAQGQGIITEAAQALIALLFDQLHAIKVVAYCAEQNIASWKVMEKLGMQREGLLQADFVIDEQWFNSYCYGQVNDQLISAQSHLS